MTDQVYEPPEGCPPYGSSKQVLGEWEVGKEGSLSGARHLHYLFMKGKVGSGCSVPTPQRSVRRSGAGW